MIRTTFGGETELQIAGLTIIKVLAEKIIPRLFRSSFFIYKIAYSAESY
jgi:hypothetical protein